MLNTRTIQSVWSPVRCVIHGLLQCAFSFTSQLISITIFHNAVTFVLNVLALDSSFFMNNFGVNHLEIY